MPDARSRLTIAAAIGYCAEAYFDGKPVEYTEDLSVEEVILEMEFKMPPKIDIIDYISYDLLAINSEAKISLLHQARRKARLPSLPKINKSWIVKPTIRARLPFH